MREEKRKSVLFMYNESVCSKGDKERLKKFKWSMHELTLVLEVLYLL